jgi:hypothetical protein
MRKALPWILPCLLLLGACGPSTPALQEPPALVHGGWVRQSLADAAPADVPESIRPLRAEKIWKAGYRGPRDISGLWIRYPNETVAFEAFQKISKNPSIRVFRRGPFFVILETRDVPPQKLGDFEEGVIKAIH